MTTPKTIGNYGGPYADAESKTNPETDLDAASGNRLLEDTAQMTRTSCKAMARFTATTTAAPTTVQPTAWRTQWGSGVDQKPTINKTATGVYTVTWATSYVDALGTSEDLGFTFADARAKTSDGTEDIREQIATIGSFQLTVYLKEANTPKDQTTALNAIECIVWAY